QGAPRQAQESQNSPHPIGSSSLRKITRDFGRTAFLNHHFFRIPLASIDVSQAALERSCTSGRKFNRFELSFFCAKIQSSAWLDAELLANICWQYHLPFFAHGRNHLQQ